MDKSTLSERDICTKFITPALVHSGWNVDSQVREEVSFTKGRIIVQDKVDINISSLEQMVKNLFYSITKNCNYEKMTDVAPIIRRPVSIVSSKSYPELGIRSFGKGTFHKPAIEGKDLGSKKLFEIREGDLLFSNVFAWEGAIAIANEHDSGRFGSHRFISCRCKKEKTNANYLLYYFR